MSTYATTASSPETRRLAILAVEVAALKLKTPVPPWSFIIESANGPIETPRPIRGMTRPRGDGRLEILIRCDQSPEKLVNSVFHECAHHKTIIDDWDRGGIPTERSISEGGADWFAYAEAPRGNYHEIVSSLATQGAEIALLEDRPHLAAAFADIVNRYDKKNAKHLQERARILASVNASAKREGIDLRSSDEKNAVHAANARQMHLELQRERLRQTAERGIERARQAAKRAEREGKELYRKIPTYQKDERGRWVHNGYHYLPN